MSEQRPEDPAAAETDPEADDLPPGTSTTAEPGPGDSDDTGPGVEAGGAAGSARADDQPQ